MVNVEMDEKELAVAWNSELTGVHPERFRRNRVL